MTTEELNALIAQAEGGDVSAMNQLTHIYGEEEGFINHEQAAKWFLELIKRDCDPNSGVYENTGYNKGLYEKIKNAVLNSATEGDMLSSLSGCPAGGSLLGGAMYFTTSNAKNYINQAEEIVQKNKIYKKEEERRRQEEERHHQEEYRRNEELRRLKNDRFLKHGVEYLKSLRASGGGDGGSLTYLQYKRVRELYMKHKSYTGVRLLDKQYIKYCKLLLEEISRATEQEEATKFQRKK